MPYIITTISGTGDGWPCNTPSGFAEIKRAVATLEEARFAAIEVNREAWGDTWVHNEGRYDDLLDSIHALTESGGTIGPLPDGTVIEVEAVSLWDLPPRGFLIHRSDNKVPSEAEIINAYNAQHAHA